MVFGFNNKEKLFITIIEEIRKSLDIDTTKQKIVEIIGKTLNADRCFITDYDKDKDAFLIVKDEYLSSKDIPAYAGANVNDDVPNFMEELKKGNYLIIDNKKIFINNKYQEYEIEKCTIEKESVNSAYGFPLFYNDELFGALGVHYLNKKYKVSKDEIKWLLSISEQIAIAIHHAKLYKKMKEHAKRENLLKDIIDKIRSSLDIEETLSFICEETAKLFNVQRVGIAMIPDINNLENYTIRKEFKTNPEIKGIDDLAESRKIFYYWADNLIHNNRIFAINNIEKSDTPDYFKNSYKDTGIKSLIGAPIKKGDDIWGILVLSEYNDYRQWEEEDKDLLSTIASQTFIAVNQAELFEREKTAFEREKLLRQIIEAIRSTFDITEIKQKVITAVAETLNANRCYIAEFDERLGRYIPIFQEYKLSAELKSMVGFEVKQNIPELVKFVQDKPMVLIPDVDKFVAENHFSDAIKNYFKDFDIKSRIYVRLSYINDFFGTLIINFPEKREKFQEKDVDFIKALANQIGIAMHQAKLYNLTQLQIRREKILETILSKSLSTFDINQIKPIVREVGIIAKADRCYFVEADEKGLSGKQIYYDGEYLASPDIKSAIGYTFPPQDVHKFVEMYLAAKDLIVFDYEEILKNKDEQFSGMQKYINQFELKSAIGIPVFYKGKLHAVLAIEYAKEKVLPTKDELEFYRILGNQIGMVFNQIQLFQDTKKTAENEKLIRNITEKIRSSLEINETLSFICEETAKLFNVQRAAISEMFPPYDSGNFIPRKEYKSNELIKGLKNVPYPKEAGAYIAQTVLDKGINLVINNFEESNTPDYFKNIYREMGVKSALCVPIKKENDKWGTIFLAEYNYYRDWSKEELNLLEIIAGQIYIAIKQAELYEITFKQAQREALLREIVEKIRSTLDIAETKKTIVEVIGKALNVDRCSIVEYDKTSDKFLLITDQYLSSDSIPNYIGLNINEEVPNYTSAIKSGHVFLINNGEVFVDSEKQKFEEEEAIIGKYSINSGCTFPLYYLNELLGALSVQYVKSEHYIDKTDINFIQLIANQVAIALYQARLYQKIQQQAERERISRNIIEILRSTLDKDIIKHLFVKNIGKYFNADRVIFSEFDYKTSKNLPIEARSEFLSSPNEKSFAGYDFTGPLTSNHIQQLVEKRELIIPNWAEYIKKTSQTPEFIAFYEEANVKSSYGFPVLYEERKMGYFCIDFTHNIVELLDEDIARLRSICTQAGIALYHAELYLQAQEALQSKGAIIVKVKHGIEKPVETIITSSKALSELKLERDKQLEYLNNIIASCNQLLELTKEIND